jgi:hypothetical protein
MTMNHYQTYIIIIIKSVEYVNMLSFIKVKDLTRFNYEKYLYEMNSNKLFSADILNERGGVKLKKLILIFALCTLSLFSILFCYADANNKTIHIIEDLPWVTRFEPADHLKYINEYNMSQQSIIAEQSINLNRLNTIFYVGNYKESFDGGSLKKCLDWDSSFEERAPLFNSELYKGYYSLRTGKILRQYQTSEFFDYAAFIKSGRQVFDGYIKSSVKDQSGLSQITFLLQEKLLDKLIELEPMKRKGFLDEALELGLPANSMKSLDCLYQMLESRVRLQLFDQMAVINKQKLQGLNLKIGIVITAPKNGKLLLQNKDANSRDSVVQIINVLQEEESFRGLTSLNELYTKPNYKLVFNEDGGSSHEIDLEKAIDAIAMDENGYVHIDLDKLFTEKIQISENTAPVISTASNALESQLKQLELLYSSKTKASGEIVKELNRYSIYLELKDKKISNIYTKGFEAGLKTWKKNLDIKFSTFGIGGMADFMAYVKQFELLDRNISKSDKARALIVKFRDSDIQFRTTEEGSIWITHMLFKIEFMK